jgi:signal transduction histidine kinase
MLLPPDSPAVECLKNIEASADRAAGVAKQMLDYSGKGGFVKEKINLNALVEKMRNSLETAVPSQVHLSFEPSDALSLTRGDPSQLQQVVMNLATNSVEAIEGRNGTIRIKTGCMKCNQDYFATCWFYDGTAEGDYVFLEISDTGCGMEKEIIKKMFDPFFSTKFIGRGLGMAAVLGIVRWHKGAIHLSSEPGIGSTFRILLPVIPESAASSTGRNNA